MIPIKKILFTASIASLLFSQTAAADILGVWQREGGVSQIKIAPCGGNFCGVIIKTEPKQEDHPSNAKIGMKVFDLKKESETAYSGTAFNPEDGQTYSGKATVSSSQLVTEGCVLGGLICKSLTWKRVK